MVSRGERARPATRCIGVCVRAHAGANLFFTEDARLVIEARGIPLFKDSSANKGGWLALPCDVG